VTSPLRIFISAPVYERAQSFGGPVEMFTNIAAGLAARGHDVDVFTTSLIGLGAGRSLESSVESVDGVRVHYLATPVRFRWMGITPTLPFQLERATRPDIVHVFGFRDPIGSGVATWCRARGVPYVFEGLGMVTPKHRKVALKRVLDSTVLRGVLGGARLLVANSSVEVSDYRDAGFPGRRIVVRPNGFPEAGAKVERGRLRELVGLGEETPLVLSVGRIARGKGFDLLVQAAAELPGAHVAIVGPDGGHGVTGELVALRDRLGLADRVHLVGALPRSELPSVYADADVFVLASSYESFGLVVAEAAAAGAAIVVTDRCGVADLFADSGAVVIPYGEAPLRGALLHLLEDAALRSRLRDEAREVARAWSWERVVELQEDYYVQALGDG
jgi:glycosyltransferase involved in cell wall biosynthesis